MKFRHEYKFAVSEEDLALLRKRLPEIMETDPNAKDGIYKIRSLYFDSPTDRALREKVDGVNHREKFRIRYYNNDPSDIHLEKKSKHNGLCNKVMVRITEEEAARLAQGDTSWMMEADRPLVRELYVKMHTQLLRPKTIVDYTREPFVYGPGNVRVTLDTDIRTGLMCTDFLNEKTPTVPAGPGNAVLEVKWDEYLPDIIRQAVDLKNRMPGAFSKYAKCRIYD